MSDDKETKVFDYDEFMSRMKILTTRAEEDLAMIEELLTDLDPNWKEHQAEEEARKRSEKMERKTKKPAPVEPTKSNAVDTDVMEVLKSARCEEKTLYLPPEQMERDLYERTNEVLTRLGGKWKGGKTRAHIFEDEIAPLLAEVLQTGIMPLDNPLDFYRTQPETVKRMLEIAGDLDGKKVLEPSAGDGAIVEVAAQYTCGITAVEIDPKRAQKLRDKFGDRATLHEVDFVTLKDIASDVVLMNPPFTLPGDKLAYVAHINHAWGLVNPGGVLVAIAPSGLKYRTDKKTTTLRGLIEQVGFIEELPAASFAESGTLVSTVLVCMRKQ